MSKKQSDADVLAKLQEMLGGRGVKDASFSSDDGNGGGGDGGNPPAPDSPQDGDTAVEEACVVSAPEPEKADEWDAGVETDQRDAQFVAFLQQCENELND